MTSVVKVWVPLSPEVIGVAPAAPRPEPAVRGKVKCTVPRYGWEPLLTWSSALTVTLNGEPAVTLAWRSPSGGGCRE